MLSSLLLPAHPEKGKAHTKTKPWTGVGSYGKLLRLSAHQGKARRMTEQNEWSSAGTYDNPPSLPAHKVKKGKEHNTKQMVICRYMHTKCLDNASQSHREHSKTQQSKTARCRHIVAHPSQCTRETTRRQPKQKKARCQNICYFLTAFRAPGKAKADSKKILECYVG